MIPLLLAALGLARAMGAVWRDSETKALPLVALLTSVAQQYLRQKAESPGSARERVRARRQRNRPAEGDGPP